MSALDVLAVLQRLGFSEAGLAAVRSLGGVGASSASLGNVLWACSRADVLLQLAWRLLAVRYDTALDQRIVRAGALMAECSLDLVDWPYRNRDAPARLIAEMLLWSRGAALDRETERRTAHLHVHVMPRALGTITDHVLVGVDGLFAALQPPAARKPDGAGGPAIARCAVRGWGDVPGLAADVADRSNDVQTRLLRSVLVWEEGLATRWEEARTGAYRAAAAGGVS